MNISGLTPAGTVPQRRTARTNLKATGTATPAIGELTRIFTPTAWKKSAVRQNAGLKLLLWFEPERALPHMPVPLKHPEYFLSNPNTGDESLLLNLGYEPAWQYCFDTISEIIEKLGIKFYRQDFNFYALEIWRAHDGANRRKGITEIKHIVRMYRLWDALMEKFPVCLWITAPPAADE